MAKRLSTADLVVMMLMTAVFMVAFSWAALDAEADAAKAACATDAECEAAYGFDMYGNR
jgi:hypothetical protein